MLVHQRVPVSSTIDLVVDPVNTSKTSVAGAVRKSQAEFFFTWIVPVESSVMVW